MVLFENLKEDFKKSLKEDVVDINPVEIPQRMVIITDGFDEIEERVSNAEAICKSLNMELSKLYLHGFGHLIKGEDADVTSLIQGIKDHSSVIRSLKDQEFIILLEETVRQLLIESRNIRKSKEEKIYEFDVDDIDAVAEYLSNDDERKQNFLEPILKQIRKIKPQIVSWKPPNLEERGIENVNPIRELSKSIIGNLHKDTWVLFDGKKRISQAESIVCVVLGGQNEKEIADLAKSVPGIIPKIDTQKLTFLVRIKQSEVHLIKMAMDQKKIEIVEEANNEDSTPEGESQKESEVIEDDNEQISDLLTKRYKSLIEPLRIKHHGVDFQILIGDLQDLEVKLRDLNTDLVLLARKESDGKNFDDETVSISRTMVRNNITTLIV